MSQPREWTTQEVQERFLRSIWEMVGYWEREDRRPETRGKLAGLAFSILATLDGSDMELPGFVVAPRPHPADRAWCEEHGENWYPEAPGVESDIAGVLHDQFHAMEPKK